VSSPRPHPAVKDSNNVKEVWAYIAATLNSVIQHPGMLSGEDITEFKRFMNDLGMTIISAQQSKSERHFPDVSEYIQSQIYQYFSYLTRVKV
jgi:hypothetical protein